MEPRPAFSSRCIEPNRRARVAGSFARGPAQPVVALVRGGRLGRGHELALLYGLADVGGHGGGMREGVKEIQGAGSVQDAFRRRTELRHGASLLTQSKRSPSGSVKIGSTT